MPPTIAQSLGTLLIGVLVATLFYGIAFVQMYYYSRSCKDDSYILKGTVLILGILETLHTVGLWIYIYHLVVAKFGDPTAAFETYWSLNLSAFFIGIIGAIVQAFFAWRVKVVSGSLILPMIVWIGAVAQFGVQIAVTVLAFEYTLLEFDAKFSWLPELNFALDVAIDAINTGALCFYLIHQRKGFSGTNQIVDKLVRWTLETGLATTLTAIPMIGLLIGAHDQLYWAGLTFFYGKLYTNCLLANLNGRNSLRGIGSSGDRCTRCTETSPNFHFGSAAHRTVEVSVQREIREDDVELGNFGGQFVCCVLYAT